VASFFAVIFRGAQTTSPSQYSSGYLSSDSFSSYVWNDITIKVYDYDGNELHTSSVLGKTYPQPTTDGGTVPAYNTAVNGTVLGKFLTIMKILVL